MAYRHNVPLVTENARDIHNSDIHVRPFSIPFLNFTNTTYALASAIAIDDISILLVDASGLAADGTEELWLTEGATHEEHPFIVLSKDVNTINLDRPIDHVYTTDARLERVYHNLAEANITDTASVTAPVIFTVTPPPNEILHVTHIHLVAESTALPAASNFMGITALTNGIVIRVVNGIRQTVGNYKKTSDFLIDVGTGYEHIDKLGGANYGTVVEWAVRTTSDAIYEVPSADGAFLEIRVQDNVEALQDLHGHVIGHFLER
jgi:hypothetical protein